LYGKNIGKHLSLDETSLSNGELYTILTNKNAKGQKGSIVAIIKGTKAEDIITVIKKINLSRRNMVKEVTVDMAPNMNLVIKKCFPKAETVTDRFHVQKLALEAVQEQRIKHRWEIIEQESKAIEKAKKQGEVYKDKWTESQKIRAQLLFELYPNIQKAYKLAMDLRAIYDKNTDKNIARVKLAKWYNQVETLELKSFSTIAKTIQNNYEKILNYFNNRSTI